MKLILYGIPAVTNATAALTTSEVRRQRLMTAVGRHVIQLTITVPRTHVYTHRHTHISLNIHYVISDFGDALLSQFLGSVLRKQNQTEQNQRTEKGPMLTPKIN